MLNKDSKIYVAGHNGLVGSAIVKELKAAGYDNLLLKRSSEVDLRDKEATKALFEKERPEFIFLAAAKVGGILYNNSHRAEFIYDNLMIESNIIELSHKYSVKKLIFLGSSCIYPKNAPQPMSEDCLLTSELEYTNEPYAIAKIAGLKMCEAYNMQYGCNFISLMPTNLYGTHDNFDLGKSHVLPALIRKIFLAKMLELGREDIVLKNLELNCMHEAKKILAEFGISAKSVEIWGSGEPRREFLYSQDLANASVFALENIEFKDLIKDKKEIINTHINVGCGEDISIKELAYLIKEIVQFNGDFYFNSSKPDGTKRKLLDISKLNSLGWKRKIELGEGIKIVYENYKNRFGV